VSTLQSKVIAIAAVLVLSGCSGLGSLGGLQAGGCVGGAQAPPNILSTPAPIVGSQTLSFSGPPGMHAAICVW
jgi:hypothetical protein